MISCQASPVADRKRTKNAIVKDWKLLFLWKQIRWVKTSILSSPVHVGVLHVLDGDPAHHLHPHRAVDEEDEGNQQHDPGQRLEHHNKMSQHFSILFTWKDFMKVQSRVRMFSFLFSSLTSLATRKRRKKEMDITCSHFFLEIAF